MDADEDFKFEDKGDWFDVEVEGMAGALFGEMVYFVLCWEGHG